MPSSTSTSFLVVISMCAGACGTSGAPATGIGGASGGSGGFAGLGGSSTGAGGSLAGGGAESGGAPGRGGSVGSGGSNGNGGAPASGGATGGTGAIATIGSGGSSSAGGARATGGATGTGGNKSEGCPGARWKLLWSDEFDGPAGSASDSSKWGYDSGPNWYNNELQYYSQGKDNATLDGSGNLVIETRKENREGRAYTSARLKTEGKKTFTYGRFESRIKVPYGKGMWPAFWLLGGNSWPNTGEIDVMEQLGIEPSVSHGAMHGPGYSGANGPTAEYTLPGGAKFSDDFHTFAVEWETDTIRWYVDGNLFQTRTKADTRGNAWVFDHPFFIILNLAVGGDWPTNPDATTVFPQKMLIDYVRVCQG